MFLICSFVLFSFCFSAPILTSSPSLDDKMTQQEEHVKESMPFLFEDKIMLSGQEADLVNFFLRPISFSADGLSYYFQYVYNHPQYAEHLPYNFAHMIQFLEYGEQNDQDTAYALSVIKLFSQKMKACPFIDGASFALTIPHISNVLQPYIKKKETSFIGDVTSKLKLHMTNIFSKYFSYFQSNPDAFMDALSKQIAQQTNQMHTQQHVDVAYLKKDILRFFELCINKLILPADDIVESWKIINDTANAFHKILQQNIFTGETAFDDVCWSLIHRFCYILNLTYRSVPKETYKSLMHQIRNSSLKLLQTEEQERFIKTKRDYLLQQLKYYKQKAYPKQKQKNQNKLERIIQSLQQ